MDYVNQLGLSNIAKYEHELRQYTTEQLSRINGLRLIGTAREKVGVLSFVCHSGSRGQQACDQFLKAGFSNAINVEGGTLACVAAGLPIVRGQKAISPERQVRIAAGSLVLLGILLGWLIHPACYGLSAFVGAGLAFAGITDTCGMGLLLARMPWNRCVQITSDPDA